MRKIILIFLSLNILFNTTAQKHSFNMNNGETFSFDRVKEHQKSGKGSNKQLGYIGINIGGEKKFLAYSEIRSYTKPEGWTYHMLPAHAENHIEGYPTHHADEGPKIPYLRVLCYNGVTFYLRSGSFTNTEAPKTPPPGGDRYYDYDTSADPRGTWYIFQDGKCISILINSTLRINALKFYFRDCAAVKELYENYPKANDRIPRNMKLYPVDKVCNCEN
ncbi:MAG: hypothetical protein H6582_01805 [Crocinitomicaceae bacterium]|nr:hypothetical protein [Crocinitomicaceae bacterium]